MRAIASRELQGLTLAEAILGGRRRAEEERNEQQLRLAGSEIVAPAQGNDK
jgi:hypothetical protein